MFAQSRSQLCEHLVATRRRFDAQRAIRDRSADPIAVARQTEEPVPLPNDVGDRSVLGAPTGGVQLVGVEERLTADAVRAFVVPLVQVAPRGARSPQTLDARSVARIAAGADHVVELDRQWAEQIDELVAVGAYEVGDRHAGRLGSSDVLQGIVVGAGEGADLVAASPPRARERVDLDQLERVSDVRRAVDVRDRGGEVDAARVDDSRVALAHWSAPSRRVPSGSTPAPCRPPLGTDGDDASATTQTDVPRGGAHHQGESFAVHGAKLPTGLESTRADFTLGREGPAVTLLRWRGSPDAARRWSTPRSQCRVDAHPTGR